MTISDDQRSIDDDVVFRHMFDVKFMRILQAVFTYVVNGMFMNILDADVFIHILESDNFKHIFWS